MTRIRTDVPVERRGSDRPWAVPVNASRDEELARRDRLIDAYERLVPQLIAQLTQMRILFEQTASLNAATAELRLARETLERLAGV